MRASTARGASPLVMQVVGARAHGDRASTGALRPGSGHPSPFTCAGGRKRRRCRADSGGQDAADVDEPGDGRVQPGRGRGRGVLPAARRGRRDAPHAARHDDRRARRLRGGLPPARHPRRREEAAVRLPHHRHQHVRTPSSAAPFCGLCVWWVKVEVIAAANALEVYRGAPQCKGPCSTRWPPPRTCAACMLQSIVLRAHLHLHACAACVCSCTGRVGGINVWGVCHGCEAHGLSTSGCHAGAWLVTPGRSVQDLEAEHFGRQQPEADGSQPRGAAPPWCQENGAPPPPHDPPQPPSSQGVHCCSRPGTAPGQSIQMCLSARCCVSHGCHGGLHLSMSHHFTLRSPGSGAVCAPAEAGRLGWPQATHDPRHSHSDSLFIVLPLLRCLSPQCISCILCSRSSHNLLALVVERAQRPWGYTCTARPRWHTYATAVTPLTTFRTSDTVPPAADL